MKPVDRLKPETWVRYRPSLCQNCQAGCCTLPVQVTTEDLYHMGFLKFEEVNGSFKEIAARLKKEGLIQSSNEREAVFTLTQKKGGDCLFLDENRRCTIYERRPTICRRFPENSARPGFCPHREKK